MSMQFFPVHGYFIPVNKENMMKFSKIDEKIRQAFVEAFEDGIKIYPEEKNPVVEDFLQEFFEQYEISPELIFVPDDSEGFSGEIVPGDVLLSFGPEDKYTMKIKKHWKVLPVEPQESSWCTLC
jgi:hypothetical protein